MKKKLLIAFSLFLAAFIALLFWRVGDVEIIKPATPPQSYLDITKAPIEFSILTYNIQARPFFDDTHHKFPFISPLLNQFDIACVQECFKDHELLWAKTKHPYKVYHANLKDPLRVVGSGLGALSNFEVQDVRTHHYTTAGDYQNKPASKGVLMLRLNIGGATVDVYDTHMEAGSNDAADASRTEQTKELISFVKENSPPENNVIFVGDYNMSPYHDEVGKEKSPRDMAKERVRKPLFWSIRNELQLGDASDDINAPDVNEIDRVLYRAGTGYKFTTLTWQRDDPKFYDPAGVPLSDHYPVFVRFKLEKL